ncbi:hypothetical protein K402DRAFT_64345 [Aulographum hederae CBS 113979]|uniref:Ribosome biogenesis protein RLP24 n=1 Tax=Aulographum hederae CBS 113979 TaxID=1176131 RepID=A0A6G1H0J8_9PEZI|nr:hypothetical protein K402DRAFT_64345 [Aulographum hederae CBS 113979]
MRIETCSFCSQPCYPSKGITFVRNDARMFRFCRSKCHKNFKMKRNPRKLAWTKSFRAAHGFVQHSPRTNPTLLTQGNSKEMVVDSTLTFAQRRNIPVRYDRTLVEKTLKAMSRVSEIRTKRERQFYKERMRGNKARQMEADRKLVAENQHLLPPDQRDVVPEGYMERMAEKQALKETQKQQKLEAQMDVEEESAEELSEAELRQTVKARKAKIKTGRKQRLIRGQGPEDMDVDD